jgi:hypothetical protein
MKIAKVDKRDYAVTLYSGYTETARSLGRNRHSVSRQMRKDRRIEIGDYIYVYPIE